ncbi:MAG: RelA/SpoT family protein [Thiotrichales bacterium]
MVTGAKSLNLLDAGPMLQRGLQLLRQTGIADEAIVETKGWRVTEIMRQIHADEETQLAALLSEPSVKEALSLAVIEREFGNGMMKLVKNVRWLQAFRPCREEIVHAPEQAERLRRLLLAVVDDVRAVLIKLGYRLLRLRTLAKASYEERRCIAREALEVLAPLANRLGVAQMKWEMEDLAFRYLEPQAYKSIAQGLEERRGEREQFITDFVQTLRTLLADAGIDAQISGRPKHIYSIWRKMQKKKVPLDELFDLRALRVMVASVHECYAALGIVHTHWHMLPREFDDYIANPKPNGYQSLHTVVIAPGSKPVEIQIRTQAMHDFAEHGFAAHWRYKEGSKQDQALQNAIASLRSLLDETRSDDSLVENFKTEVFPDKVFALTPKGEVIELPRGATALDFAYAIHTDLGHRCRGAKVDGHIVPLTQSLQNAQQVEIITTKQPRPSRDWMNPSSGYLISARARGKVRQWFHQLNKAENIDAGKRIFEQTQKRFGAMPKTLPEILQQFHLPDEESLYVAIGRGDIRQVQLDGLFRAELPLSTPSLQGTVVKPTRAGKTELAEAEGVDNLMTRVAHCCNPVPGDDVIGYITLGQGITVHRVDCGNILSLPDEKRKRLIQIRWGDRDQLHDVEIEIRAYDRRGLLNDVTKVLVDQKANLIRANTYTDPRTQDVSMKLTIQVRDHDHLCTILERMDQVPNVFEARRAHTQ